MARFDTPHSPHDPQPADPLLAALQDVAIPEGMESRLLAAVNADLFESDRSESGTKVAVAATDLLGDAHETAEAPRGSRWSRRRILSAGVAAGVGSIFAGAFVRSRRRLDAGEVLAEVDDSLSDQDWVAWEPVVGGTAIFPRSLRRSLGWQTRGVGFSSSVAFNMSLPGCPKAVLFAIKTPRDLAEFAKTPPPTPQISRTGVWSHIAMWQDPNEGVLYVLAIQSDEVTIKRDYPRLFRAGPTAPLA